MARMQRYRMNSAAQPAEPTQRKYRPGRLDIFLYGITIVIGGNFFSWNIGFAAGIGGYFIAFVLMTIAYVTFCCCMAEITGALPFAGGAYGLARCTLGFFPAFLVGACEAIEYIACTATTMISLAGLFVEMLPALRGYEPLIWLMLYVSILIAHLRGGGLFWAYNIAISCTCLIIIVIYHFGCVSLLDIRASALNDKDQYFIDGFMGFWKMLPFGAWFYTGIECLNLASNDVSRPKTMIPAAQVGAVTTLFALCAITYFMTIALPVEGGISTIATAVAPLNNGFLCMFDISNNFATLLSIPATYGAAFGFIWSYGKLIHALAAACLLPPWLAKSSTTYGTHYMALLVGSLVSYCVCLIVYFYPEIATYVFSVCLMFAFMSYTGQCIGYISLKVNYPSLQKSTFKNPFGIPGAVSSAFVWILALLSLCFAQGNNGTELAFFSTIIAILTAVYFLYSKKRQVFSEEENRVLLVAHIMKFNRVRATAGGNKRSVNTSSNKQTVTVSSKIACSMSRESKT